MSTVSRTCLVRILECLNAGYRIEERMRAHKSDASPQNSCLPTLIPTRLPPGLTRHLGNVIYVLELDGAQISFWNCGDFFRFDLKEKRLDASLVEYEEGRSEATEG